MRSSRETPRNRWLIRSIWNRWLGASGEKVAAQFLGKQGMKVLVRGYRTAQGEVDLICRDKDWVVFVEVKTRKQGSPAEAVDPTKQRRLTLAALHFLKRYRLLDSRCRFDVVAITWPTGGSPDLIEHFRDAFPAVGQGQMFR